MTQRAECALRDLAPVVKAEGITLFPRLLRVADFIETSVAGIRSSLLLGGALVANRPDAVSLQPAYCVHLAHRDPSNVARPRPTSERRLAAILSPLGWEHNLTGDYVWRTGAKVAAGKVQAVATAANGLACFISRFLRRPHVHVVARIFGHV